MADVAFVVALCVIVIGLLHIPPVLLFIRTFYRPAIVIEGKLPKVAVRLCLRGDDPHLPDCLKRLMHLDYPDYELHVIVDHEDDPAWNVVQQVVREGGAKNVVVKPLRQRLDTCGLKNSAILQMIHDLDPSVEVVAGVDGDVLVHPSWLRELVAPLADPTIGATSGNRWFMPAQGRLGSLVRYVWFAGGAPSTYLMGMPWGGSMAMRVDHMRRADLLGQWAKAVVEDAPVTAELKKVGLKVAFVPSLIMTNREECSVPACLRLIARWQTWNKLYYGSWTSVLAHSLVLSATVLAPFGLGAWGLVSGDYYTLFWSALGGSVYFLLMLGLIGLLEANVRRPIRARGEATAWMSPAILLKLLIAVPLSPLLNAVAVIQAHFRRSAEWRGVTYQIRGPWDIRLVDYQPFREAERSVGATSSI